MKNKNLIQTNKSRIYKEQEIIDLKKEITIKGEYLDAVIRARKTCNKFGIAGKLGIAYIGLRAAGRLIGIGPELTEEIILPDKIVFCLTYIGSLFWVSAKTLQHTDEKKHRQEYQNAVSRLEKKII